MAAKNTGSLVLTPSYWDDACKHLMKKDRVMKRLIPQFGEACLRLAPTACRLNRPTVLANFSPAWARSAVVLATSSTVTES